MGEEEKKNTRRNPAAEVEEGNPVPDEPGVPAVVPKRETGEGEKRTPWGPSSRG